MKDFLFFLLIFLFFASCNFSEKETINRRTSEFVFPQKKLWAHRVGSFEEVEKKHQFFDGLEVDLRYTNILKNFYVAHNETDTLNQILFEDWIQHIPNPTKNWYWIDLKNLYQNDAKEIALLLVNILNKYGILHKTICESKNVEDLAVLKKNGLAVSYWIEPDFFFRSIIGKWIWKRKINKNIAFLNPDAISASYSNLPKFSSDFSNENILFWNTPIVDTIENFEITRKLCNIANVKVVLVDYDAPISY
jgi:hypothetical protein